MTTNIISINPEFGPFRRGLIRTLTVLFVIGLAAMLLLGAVLVALQLGGLVMRNAEFIIDASAAVGPVTYAVSAGVGVLTLIIALAHGWTSNE